MISLKTVIELKPALEVLGNLKFVSAAKSYRLAAFMQQLTPSLSAFEKERIRIVMEYGSPVGDGSQYNISVENMPSFIKAISEMEQEPVEGIKVPTMSLRDLRPGTPVKPIELYPLIGSVIPVDTYPPDYFTSVTLLRNEVLMLYAGIRSIANNEIKDYALADKLMISLYELGRVVEVFQRQESELQGTPEEQGQALAKLYNAENTYTYSLPLITLEELEGMEIEPMTLMNINCLLQSDETPSDEETTRDVAVPLSEEAGHPGTNAARPADCGHVEDL